MYPIAHEALNGGAAVSLGTALSRASNLEIFMSKGRAFKEISFAAQNVQLHNDALFVQLTVGTAATSCK
jgi:hypothetical protein